MVVPYVLIIFLFFAGCASTKNSPVVLLSGVSKEGAPICLDERSGIPAAVQKFYSQRDLTTEEGKIDYLLERIRGSKLIFVRNKVEYVGPAAASFLHWKLDRWRSRHYAKITTAQEFVNLITRGSKVSGEPYSAILKDGTRHDLQNVLQNELDALEACLKQLPPNSPEMNTQNLTQSATEVSSVKADIQKGLSSSSVSKN
jgi:hypothetical protein